MNVAKITIKQNLCLTKQKHKNNKKKRKLYKTEKLKSVKEGNIRKKGEKKIVKGKPWAQKGLYSGQTKILIRIF